MHLRLVAPVPNGLQPAVTSENGRTDLRRQHAPTGNQFGFARIVDGNVLCVLVFGAVFEFINKFAPKSISVSPDIEAYFNFVLGMFLAFGIAFEIPVVVVVLAITGIVKIEQLREWRGYVIVGIFVVAAVVTPPSC